MFDILDDMFVGDDLGQAKRQIHPAFIHEDLSACLTNGTEDSTWFRLPKEVNSFYADMVTKGHPLPAGKKKQPKLDNMRYFVRLYRKL